MNVDQMMISSMEIPLESTPMLIQALEFLIQVQPQEQKSKTSKGAMRRQSGIFTVDQETRPILSMTARTTRELESLGSIHSLARSEYLAQLNCNTCKAVDSTPAVPLSNTDLPLRSLYNSSNVTGHAMQALLISWQSC